MLGILGYIYAELERGRPLAAGNKMGVNETASLVAPNIKRIKRAPKYNMSSRTTQSHSTLKLTCICQHRCLWPPNPRLHLLLDLCHEPLHRPLLPQ